MSDNTLNSFLFQRLDALSPLKRGLDAFSLRQKAIASNIANSETPGYRARRVEFENELMRAFDRIDADLSRTDRRHFAHGQAYERINRLQPQLVEENSPPENGINNVSIEEETADLATNQIQYQLASRLLNMRYRMLKSAIMSRSM